jgi:hypothetical protein
MEKVARPQKKIYPLLSQKNHLISSLNHAKLLIFGKSKEKTPIYYFTKAFLIPPAFT